VCSSITKPTFRILLANSILRAVARAFITAGSKKDASMPMIEITANSSCNVMPDGERVTRLANVGRFMRKHFVL